MKKMDWGGGGKIWCKENSYQNYCKNSRAWTKAVGMETAIAVINLLEIFFKIMWLFLT